MPHARAGSRRLPRLAATLAVAVSLLLASCSGGSVLGDDRPEDQPEDKGGEARQVTRSPLTGLRVKGDGPAHPVIAVKIDNSSSSAPQIGLGSADLVAEELVEGGITRLAAFFWTDVPRIVGPVRSMRGTDIGIVRPLDAVLVASGGAPPTVARVKDAGIRTFTEGAPGYYREGSRVAPYNLFMRLGELARTLDGSEPPAPYLPFRKSPSLPEGQPAKGLTATFSPSSSSTFELRDGGYVNTDTLAAPDDQFVADTVLVLRVRVEDAGYRDPAGNPVPETVFEGGGDAMIFHGGRLVRGTWRKDSLGSAIRLRSAGKKVTLPRGKVWIELVPVEGGSVSVTG